MDVGVKVDREELNHLDSVPLDRVLCAEVRRLRRVRLGLAGHSSQDGWQCGSGLQTVCRATSVGSFR